MRASCVWGEDSGISQGIDVASLFFSMPHVYISINHKSKTKPNMYFYQINQIRP